MLLDTQDRGSHGRHRNTQQPSGCRCRMDLGDQDELTTWAKDPPDFGEAAQQAGPVVVGFDSSHEVELGADYRESGDRSLDNVHAPGGDQVGGVRPGFGDTPCCVVDADDSRGGSQVGQFLQGPAAAAADIENRALRADLDMTKAPVSHCRVAPIHIPHERAAQPTRWPAQLIHQIAGDDDRYDDGGDVSHRRWDVRTDLINSRRTP